MLRELFPNGRFSAPASEAQIADVEEQLGIKLPLQLKELYRECDGFREDRGNAKYLLSLTEEDQIGSLLGMTRFWWSEWKDRLPTLSDYVFFGSSSGDESWGINWKREDEIIAYHHHMENEVEILGDTIVEVYLADYAKYDDAG
jgi:hypothetical protein